MALRLSFDLEGKNPAKKNLSAGKADAVSAAMAADAPGTGNTG